MVYMDDNLMTDPDVEPDIIIAMKQVVRKELKDMDVRNDLSNGPPRKSTKYLGWLVDLNTQATTLPPDKLKKIKTRIQRFRDGKVHVKTGKAKKWPMRFYASEIAALAGSLVHFATLHENLKSFLPPIYRLLDNFKFSDHKSKTLRRIHMNKYWLNRSLDRFEYELQLNSPVPFISAAASFGTPKDCLRTYADASGRKSVFNPRNYGMGGITPSVAVAWQCKRKIYYEWLMKANDTQISKNHIITEELLAQVFNLFVLHKKLSKFTKRRTFETFCDSSCVTCWQNKKTAKHAFQAALIYATHILEKKMESLIIPAWCCSADMEISGADPLSREFIRRWHGIHVTQINTSMFAEFCKFFKNSGATNYYLKLIWNTCPARFDQR